MPSFSIVMHTHNAERHLGRALESLRPADEIILIDHGSTDATLRIAHEYGAKVFPQHPEDLANPVHCTHDWIFFMSPDESLSEGLEVSLFEWKESHPEIGQVYSVSLREQVRGTWRKLRPESRLFHRTLITTDWIVGFLTDSKGSFLLPGDLLRFSDDA